ncbi:MAG: hypothetical protein ACKN9T_06560 [Candidatus Methylumidiphilus sp.]
MMISAYYIAHEIAATYLTIIHLGDALDWRFAAACPGMSSPRGCAKPPCTSGWKP